jgi:ornithine carrier protein
MAYSDEPPKADILSPFSTKAKDGMKDILFGSVAGIVGKFMEYPFDTIKVRLQAQPDHLPLQYKGPLDCFRQSIRRDGVGGLYRGVGAPLFGAAVETSSLFFSVSGTNVPTAATAAGCKPNPIPLLTRCNKNSTT